MKGFPAISWEYFPLQGPDNFLWLSPLHFEHNWLVKSFYTSVRINSVFVTDFPSSKRKLCDILNNSLRDMAGICRKWRLWILPVLTCLYALLIIILVPILLANSIQNGFKKQDQGALVGGAFVLLALPIAFYEIIQHMIHYTQPRLQKYIIRWDIISTRYIPLKIIQKPNNSLT